MANEFKVKNGLVVDAGGINATGSVNITGSLIVGSATISEFQVQPTGVVIGNIITDIHNITGSVRISGSLNATASNSVSASYAATSSFANNFTVAGTLTAQTINVQTITSSIEFNTGSTRNGSLTTNTHEFTGSILANSTNSNAFSVNTNTIYVSSSNNVGVGVLPSNTYKLEVNGTVGAVGYYETSDIRLKNVIETNPTIDLSSINVIKYNLYGSQDIHYGYSAQQVQSICSDLVKSGEYLSLNYTDIHTLKILQLEQKIAQLEAQLSK